MGKMKTFKRETNEHETHNINYSETYDAKYCVNCDKWLEKTCNDVECQFCYGRPVKPSQIDK